MNRQGTIKKIDGKYVWISLAPLGCCGGQEGGSCHCSSSSTEVEFKAINQNDLNLSVGDYVEASTPTKAAWGGVFRLLVVPAALLAVGWVAFGPWIGTGAAVTGLLFSVLFPQNQDTGFPKVERVIPVADFTPFAQKA